MKFKLEIKCDNVAFRGTEFDRAYEIARILRGAAVKVEANGANVGEVFPLFDTNGNFVGEAKGVK